MRERKKKYIDKIMNFLDCEHFQISNSEAVKAICDELGIYVPEGKDVHFRYYPYSYGDGELMLRVDYVDKFYNITDTMLDEAFFHYVKIMQTDAIEKALVAEAKERAKNIIKTLKDYNLEIE